MRNQEHNLKVIKGVPMRFDELPIRSGGPVNINAIPEPDDDEGFDLPPVVDVIPPVEDTPPTPPTPPVTTDGDEPTPPGDDDEVVALYDAQGNSVNEKGEIVKTKAELDAEVAAATPEPPAADEPKFFDREGNQIDAKGEVVKTKAQLELDNFAELTVIKQLQVLHGYEIKDEAGELVEFPDTVEGIKDYTDKLATAKAQEILQSEAVTREETTPDIVKAFEAHVRSGLPTESFFNSPLLNIQNVKLDAKDPSQLKDIIRRDFELRGYDAAKQAQQKVNLAAQQEANQNAAQQTNKTIVELVSKGKINDVIIPDKERKQFLDYVTKPVTTTKGQVLTQYDIDVEKQDLSTDVLNAYYAFKKYDLSSVVKDKVNKEKATTLTERLFKAQQPHNNPAGQANVIGSIDYDKL